MNAALGSNGSMSSPYRLHAEPPDLVEIARTTARLPPRIVALRGFVVAGFVLVVVGCISALWSSRVHTRPLHAGFEPRTVRRPVLSQATEEDLMREHGMYAVWTRYAPPKSSQDLWQTVRCHPDEVCCASAHDLQEFAGGSLHTQRAARRPETPLRKGPNLREIDD